MRSWPPLSKTGVLARAIDGPLMNASAARPALANVLATTNTAVTRAVHEQARRLCRRVLWAYLRMMNSGVVRPTGSAVPSAVLAQGDTAWPPINGNTCRGNLGISALASKAHPPRLQGLTALQPGRISSDPPKQGGGFAPDQDRCCQRSGLIGSASRRR